MSNALSTICLHMNREANVDCNFNCIFKNEGLFKVKLSHTVDLVASQKACKRDESLLL